MYLDCEVTGVERDGYFLRVRLARRPDGKGDVYRINRLSIEMPDNNNNGKVYRVGRVVGVELTPF